MKVMYVAVLLLLSGSPLGHAAGLKAAAPHPEIGHLRGLQTNSTVSNSSIPVDDYNATAIAESARDDQKDDPESACCTGTKQGEGLLLTFQFTGGGCGASNYKNAGPDGNKDEFSCSGVVGDSPSITNSDITDGFLESPGGALTIGQTFVVRPDGGNDLGFTIGGQTLENIHTSCSRLLYVGDVYGSLTLVSYAPTSDKCMPPVLAPTAAPTPMECVRWQSRRGM